MAENNLKLTIRTISADNALIGDRRIGPLFRIEEQEGALAEGVSIPPGFPEEGKTLEVRSGEKGVFRLAPLYGFPLPDRFYDKSGGLGFPPTRMSVSYGNPCSSDLSLFSPRDLPRNSKLLETKIGDFDHNGLVDFAYVVRRENQTVSSLVYYQENLARCFDEPKQNLYSEIAIFGILAYQKKITPEMQKVIREYITLSVQRDYVHNGYNVRVDISDELKNLSENDFLERLTAYNQLLEKVRTLPHILYESYRVRKDLRTQYYQLATRLFSPEYSDAQNFLAFRLATYVVEGFAERKELLSNDKIKIIAKNIKATVSALSERRIVVLKYLLDLKRKDDEGEELAEKFSVFEDPSFERNKHRYNTLYKLIGGAEDISPQQLQKYAPLLENIYPPQIRDVIACEETIGVENALLLAEKLNVTRFGRYDESVLWHNVKLLTDREHEKTKPLILSVVAKSDETDALYWGRHFELDERVRVIIIEAGSTEDFLVSTKRVVNDYGEPDSILISAHGIPGSILFGDEEKRVPGSRITMNFLDLEKIKLFFDEHLKSRPQIVVNSCDIATDTNGMNLAQSLSNYTGSEVRAAKGIEAMFDLKLDFENGKARLFPNFFQIGGLDTLGYVIGDELFTPQEIPLPTEVPAASVSQSLK